MRDLFDGVIDASTRLGVDADFRANVQAARARLIPDCIGRAGQLQEWAEDWDLYHRAMGEVHCGTNATRKVPDSKWWESGR